jgi:hypothetical protein
VLVENRVRVGKLATVSLLHRARLLARRVGIDVSRFPGAHPMYVLVRLLQSHSINVVLDVGANSARLWLRIARDGLYRPHRLVRATRPDVAANAGESSSILPMLDAHVEAAPSAIYIGSEEARLRTLDSFATEILNSGDRAFLKADVQGYERLVPAGAESILRDYCVGIQL